MTLPDFIIAGAPRCGTTYLYDLLDAHPDVYMAKPRNPEPKFFLIDSEYAQGIDYYADKYFSGASGQRAIGEKSTNYLESPIAAQRIHACLPEVKLIFLLRNPIERAYSNYRWSSQNGHESLTLEEAIEQEPKREAAYDAKLRFSRPFSYVSRGCYARLLAPYFALFSRDRVAVVLMDDIAARPREVQRAVLSFLELPDVPTSFDLNQRINESSFDAELTPQAHETLRRLYLPHNRALEQLIARDLSAWDRPFSSQLVSQTASPSS